MQKTERLAAIQRGDYFVVPGVQRLQDDIIISCEQRHQEEFQQNLPPDSDLVRTGRQDTEIVDYPTLSRFYYTSLLASAKGAVQAGIHRYRRVFLFGKQPYARWANKDVSTDTHTETSYVEFSVGIDATDSQGKGRETATDLYKFIYWGTVEAPDPAVSRLSGSLTAEFVSEALSTVTLSWRGTNRPHDLPKIFGQRALFTQAFLDIFGFNRGLPNDIDGLSRVTFNLLPVIPLRTEVNKYPVLEFDYLWTDHSRGIVAREQLASHFGYNDSKFQFVPIEPLCDAFNRYFINRRDYGNGNIREGAIDFKEITKLAFLKFLEYVLEIIPG